MQKQQIIQLLICIIAHTTIVICKSECTCTPNSTKFPGANNYIQNNLSQNSEIVESIEVGKLIHLGTQITVLQNLKSVSKSSNNNLNHSCPQGYIPITKDELDQGIKSGKFDEIISENIFSIPSTAIVFSNTKVNPLVIDQLDDKAYEYYAMKYNDEKKLVLVTASTKDTSDDNRKTLCKKDLTNFALRLEGYDGYDLNEAQIYEIKVNNENVMLYHIEDSNGKVYTTQKFNYTHTPNSQGCATINFRVQLFGGAIFGDCIAIWTKFKFNYDVESSLTVDDFTKVKLNGIKSNVNNNLFLSPGSAPIAPILNDSSSVYVYFSDKATNILTVQKLSKAGVAIGNPINTKEVGEPFDIVSTYFGFVVMARDSKQKAWISAFNKDGTLRWSRTLMSNGVSPTSATDQMKFTINQKCDLSDGMQVMYNPLNGKLNYARGRIQAIWSHNNYFGMNKDGTRNDRSGDSMISLDADTGSDQKIYWGWGAQNSLQQTLHYDGKYLFVASLGDSNPSNVLFRVCDVDLNLQCKASSVLILDDIQGNGKGQSTGRIGGFTDVYSNKKEKYFVYSRKICLDDNLNNCLNEFLLFRMDRDLQFKRYKYILKDTEASRVNAIKIAKYGENILVAYSLIPLANVSKFNNQDVNSDTDESYMILLKGTNLDTIYGPTKFSEYQISSSDEWRVLEDGRIAYTLVDGNNNLNFYYTLPLEVPSQFPNLNSFSRSTNLNGNFPLIKTIIKNNNFNEFCFKQNGTNTNNNNNNSTDNNNNQNNNNNNINNDNNNRNNNNNNSTNTNNNGNNNNSNNNNNNQNNKNTNNNNKNKNNDNDKMGNKNNNANSNVTFALSISFSLIGFFIINLL